MESDSLELVFHHLVLPPKLPTKGLLDTNALEVNIVLRFIEATKSIATACADDNDLMEVWSSVQDMLRRCLTINDGRLDKAVLRTQFQELKPGRTLILHIIEQNAALLVRRETSDREDAIIFESFEASPPGAEILAAKCALQWHFPGRCAKIPAAVFFKASFQECVTTALESASSESLSRFAARTIKAKQSVVETRDTTDPAFITQMLMPFLEAVGEALEVPRLRKRIHDDINFRNAEIPWRRLPFYLVLRVGLERHLILNFGDFTGRASYKFLICSVLSFLVKECAGRLAPEQTVQAQKKLGRRLAKLVMEAEKEKHPKSVYNALFTRLGDGFKATLQQATSQVELAWKNFTQLRVRKIHTLPVRPDLKEYRLDLPNSGRALDSLIKQSSAQPSFEYKTLAAPDIKDAGTLKVGKITDEYFGIAQMEQDTRHDKTWSVPDTATQCKKLCVQISESIRKFQQSVGKAYAENKELLSLHILDLFVLFVRMDMCAIQACPLLEDYPTPFEPQLLDVLHLPKRSDMERLQQVQHWLQERFNRKRHMTTIIANVDKDAGSFATQYFATSPSMQELRDEIDEASADAHAAKLTQWQDACHEFDDLTEKMSTGICVCTLNDDGTKDVKGCFKCFQRRKRNRMTISAHENFLPENQNLRAAVVFEMAIPHYLAAYRGILWDLVKLGHPGRLAKPSAAPVILLKEYSQLRPFMKTNTGPTLSLASDKKSFLQTHYSSLKMKVDRSDIFLQFGMNFLLFDETDKLWIHDLAKPLTLQHLCAIEIPSRIVGTFPSFPDHPETQRQWPSSYTIIANQTKCPPGVAFFEHSALQKVLSGQERRWIQILVELGASNMNLSSEDTMVLLTELAVESGPASPSADPLRATHGIFRDQGFCQQLVRQLEARMIPLTDNWREVYCMNALILLTMRLFSLTAGQTRREAERLLKMARKTTCGWIIKLRAEMSQCQDPDEIGRVARYGMWAALLCRWTFSFLPEAGRGFSPSELETWIQASIALQENLVTDLDKLDRTLRGIYIRDIQMAFELRGSVKTSIKAHPEAVTSAIGGFWTGSGDRTFDDWEFFTSPNDRWVGCRTVYHASGLKIANIIHFNYVEGHLLIDDSPLTKLPLEIRESPHVKALFGVQHLVASRSTAMDGMTHRLLNALHGCEVYFGRRDGHVIIRTMSRAGLSEYIPPQTFKSGELFDMPSSLIDNSVHWLNLTTRKLHIRRQLSRWWDDPATDWILDLTTRRAQRRRAGKVEILVNLQSATFNKIGLCFDGFEHRQSLTVYHRETEHLCVDLRNFELSFFVNGYGRLECRELKMEIDPDQDCGTFYGYKSMIVLRDRQNSQKRSLISPLGKAYTSVRDGMHVSVYAINATNYAKFEISKPIGRISCAAEPFIALSKVLIHAHTSFVLPDPLTGRTGAEEALSILRSGSTSPWTELSQGPWTLLKALGQLSPVREFYPPTERHLQTVVWNPNLTMTIQQDDYENLVRGIMTKSNNLRVFSGTEKQDFMEVPDANPLRERGELQRSRYEASRARQSLPSEDIVYRPRDRDVNLREGTGVYQIVRFLIEKPPVFEVKKSLLDLMSKAEYVGGYGLSLLADGSGSLSDAIDEDVISQWGSFFNVCRKTDPNEPYPTYFRLGLSAFSTKPNMDALRALGAATFLPELKSLGPPAVSTIIDPNLPNIPTESAILSVIRTTIQAFGTKRMDRSKSSARQQPAGGNSTTQMQNLEFEREGQAAALARHLSRQWPCESPTADGFQARLLNLDAALSAVGEYWERLHGKNLFKEHIANFQQILNLHRGENIVRGPRSWTSNNMLPVHSHFEPITSLPILIRKTQIRRSVVRLASQSRQLALPAISSKLETNDELEDPTVRARKSADHEKLDSILDRFTQSSDLMRNRYGQDLRDSLKALINAPKRTSQKELEMSKDQFEGYMKELAICESQRKRHYEGLSESLAAASNCSVCLQLGHLWPRITIANLLKLLRTSDGIQMSSDAKDSLVAFALLVTKLQQLHRMIHLMRRSERHKLASERANPGHTNWDPANHPDWLLLEVESDLLIRPEQVDVAHAIISPTSKANSVLQLNMGQGKTSCIVPMAMAVLADGKKSLARLIVPKPLLRQSAEIIQLRLGGLLGREARHIAFSRRTSTTEEMLRLYWNHHKELLDGGGIVLAIPEHILSFRLSGLQRLIDDKLDQARPMIRIQRWLDSKVRDVLDESDVILGPRTQLIYPGGSQISVDASPHRWQIPQILLSLIQDHLPTLRAKFKHNIEITIHKGYPTMCFLKQSIEDHLNRLLAEDLCEGRASFLVPQSPLATEDKDLLMRVLIDDTIGKQTLKKAVALFPELDSATLKKILLVRGLLSNGILTLCLKKRWNVQYGLHPDRHPVAVPYESKGRPSELAEFGHADVAIILTCLAFYYSGLTQAQVREGLQRILRSEDPATSYDRWTQGSELDETLRHWNFINTDDANQMSRLWEGVRYTRSAINDYLNHFVFPRHAKSFTIKLESSAWDLPVYHEVVESTRRLSAIRSTGFSGTNDTRIMLPLTIKQDDLPSLQHTNAEVLTYLLDRRNRTYRVACKLGGRRLTEVELLHRLCKDNIPILIDAGAFFLEHSNEGVAEAWLRISPDAKGAVYFSNDGRAWVIYKDPPQKVPLHASPFADNLNECLVYLDEAHTRGVDLQLPNKAIGALTLALGQVKDHTVQAAMRLRQLGTTQSIVFYAPPEVDRSIKDICGLKYDARVNSSHVVEWLLEQTCVANGQLRNLYVAQGVDFIRRVSGRLDAPDFLDDENHRDALIEVIRTVECHTLEELYGPKSGAASDAALSIPAASCLKPLVEELNKQRSLTSGDILSLHHSVLEEVEQEREVEYEMEAIVEKQKPNHYKPLSFTSLHPVLMHLAKHGTLSSTEGNRHAFSAMASTELGKKHGVRYTGSQLYVSDEYMRTVQLKKKVAVDDSLLRPVEWILWCPAQQIAMIIIPEEADLIIPILHQLRNGKAYLLSYAAPLTKMMLHFNGLRYYNIPKLPEDYNFPEWLPIELRVFAGRLYFEFSEYAALKQYLEWWEEPADKPRFCQGHLRSCLLNFLSLRRNGQDILHTPMGYLLQGRELHEGHVFFSSGLAEAGDRAPQGDECYGEDDISEWTEPATESNSEMD